MFYGKDTETANLNVTLLEEDFATRFRTPFSVTENDIVHCVLILQGVMSYGFHPVLPLTGGSDPGGVTSGVGLRPAIVELSVPKESSLVAVCS